MSTQSSSEYYLELPFHSEETIKWLPFEIRPPNAMGDSLQVFFNPWSKGKLGAIVKEFLSQARSLQVFVNQLPTEPSPEKKIKFHIVPSFPNPGQFIIDTLSPRDNNDFLAFILQTWLGFLPAWDVQVVSPFGHVWE